MTFTLTALRTDVAAALRDASNAAWTTAQLDLAIGQARAEYEEFSPRQQQATLTGISSRTIDLSAATPGGLGAAAYAALVRVVAVEYPTGQWPPAYVRWDQFAANLVMHTDAVPSAASVLVSFDTLHTLDGSGGTIPDEHRQLLLAGSVYYALQQYRREAATSVTTQAQLSMQLDGIAAAYRDTWTAGLKRLRRLRATQLYRPSDASLQRDVVQFPE